MTKAPAAELSCQTDEIGHTWSGSVHEISTLRETLGLSVDLPKALLLDLDGTLLESEHHWLAAEVEVMAGYGKEWSVDDQRHCLGGPLERVSDYMAHRIGGNVDPIHIGQALLETVGKHFSAHDIEWRPGACELVMQAHQRGIPTAIVTASWRSLLDSIIDQMTATAGEFTASVAGDEVTLGKPHAEPYLKAAQILGVKPRECLALEDSITGATSAFASGARVVAIAHLTPIRIPGVAVVDTLSGQSIEDLWGHAKIVSDSMTQGIFHDGGT